MFLKKGVLELCSKFTGEHPCQSGTSMKLQSNLLKLHFGMRVFAISLLYIFRTPLPKNSSGWLLVADGGHWHRGNGEIFSFSCREPPKLYDKKAMGLYG